MLFPGTSCPKSAVLLRIATYAVSENSLMSVSVPKYFLPAALAARLRPVADEPPEFVVVVTVVVVFDEVTVVVAVP